MVTKKKVARKATAKTTRSFIEYVPDSWVSHPRITLATVATVLGLLFAAGPTIVWALHYYETRADATIAYENQRKLLEQHKLAVARIQAWSAVGDARRDGIVARNRVNDCNILKQKHQLSGLEQAACQQYDDDLIRANKSLDMAQSSALAASKE